MKKNKSKRIPYINRELSWLEFNERVLAQAADADLPLFERLKFLAITSSNLDEFMMVRIGGLKLAYKAGLRNPDPAGLTVLMQLRQARRKIHDMVNAQYSIFSGTIEPELRREGIVRCHSEELDEQQKHYLLRLFETEFFPVLTPMILDSENTLPLLRNLELYMAVELKPEKEDRTPDYAVIPFGVMDERIIFLPSSDEGRRFILSGDVVSLFLSEWFPGREILSSAILRMTRNADIAVSEDEAADLMSGMETILKERQTSDCIRLEISKTAGPGIRDFFASLFELDRDDIYDIPGPIDMRFFMKFSALEGFEHLHDEAWLPQTPAGIDAQAPMFEQISEQDRLFCHPYDSFEPVMRFISEAADDPDVLAIKQVLYRTSSRSPVIRALSRAAKNGKNVTVLVELKARFDEARNIEWARKLEEDGVQVIYGVRKLKTHAKICIVVRREESGIVRYMHFGTGNYNDSTAKLYTDISYLTCDPVLGEDASAFFNIICGYSHPVGYRSICMAPLGLREELVRLIDNEIERSKGGQPARIMAKMNSLVDPVLIERLYAASCAGVKIDLNVRGICSLMPGVKDVSENIRVISIIDRFLEHARIFYFHNGAKPHVLISSADWMPRNLDRRVELLVPVENIECKRKLIEILDVSFSDTQKSWTLESSGRYKRNIVKEPSGVKVRSQQALYEHACSFMQLKERGRKALLHPSGRTRNRKVQSVGRNPDSAKQK